MYLEVITDINGKAFQMWEYQTDLIFERCLRLEHIRGHMRVEFLVLRQLREAMLSLV